MTTEIIDDVKIDEKIKQTTTSPKKYKVVLLNDDSTPMDWVVGVLVDIFKHSETWDKLFFIKGTFTKTPVVPLYKLKLFALR